MITNFDYLKSESKFSSFADIAIYSKVKQNLIKNGIEAREWTESQMREFAQRLSELNNSKGWNFELATCGEKIDLTEFGVKKNRCSDDDLIIRLAYNDKVLMDYLGVTIEPIGLFGTETLSENVILLPGNMCATHGDNRDKGQRQFCGCIKSKDIGEYNTCIHSCEYCYANASKERALENYKKHLMDKTNESIT